MPNSEVPRIELNQDGTINLVVDVSGFDPGTPIEISGQVTQENGAVATFYNVQPMPQSGSVLVPRLSAVPDKSFVAGFPVTVVARAAQVWITSLEADTGSAALQSRVVSNPLQAAWKGNGASWAVSWPGQNAPAVWQTQSAAQSSSAPAAQPSSGPSSESSAETNLIPHGTW